MIGDLCQIIGSIFLSINTSQTVKQAEIMLGFGAFISWCTMIKYIENSKGYNIITNTTIKSMAVLLKAFLGISPLIIGSSLLALCFFNDHNRYSNGAMSIFSLSAIAYGDSIFDMWFQTKIYVVLIAEVFNYIVVFVAIGVVMNAFIMIVGDGYEDSKGYEKHEWINQELPPPTTKEEKQHYVLIKILKKDIELVNESWMMERIAKKEEKLGKKIAKTEEEIYEEEQAEKSMEFHTRHIISLMKDLRENYEAKKEEDPENIYLDQQYQQLCEDLKEFLDNNKPLEDKSFYF